jgi:hypothetical protein
MTQTRILKTSELQNKFSTIAPGPYSIESSSLTPWAPWAPWGWMWPFTSNWPTSSMKLGTKTNNQLKADALAVMQPN